MLFSVQAQQDSTKCSSGGKCRQVLWQYKHSFKLPLNTAPLLWGHKEEKVGGGGEYKELGVEGSECVCLGTLRVCACMCVYLFCLLFEVLGRDIVLSVERGDVVPLPHWTLQSKGLTGRATSQIPWHSDTMSSSFKIRECNNTSGRKKKLTA